MQILEDDAVLRIRGAHLPVGARAVAVRQRAGDVRFRRQRVLPARRQIIEAVEWAGREDKRHFI